MKEMHIKNKILLAQAYEITKKIYWHEIYIDMIFQEDWCKSYSRVIKSDTILV